MLTDMASSSSSASVGEPMEETHRTLTMANSTGDTTISWTADNDAEMRQLIADKLAQGFSFFIIEHPTALARLLGRNAQVMKVTDIAGLKGRSVTIADAEAEALFSQGRIGVVRQGSGADGNLPLGERSRDPSRLAAGHSIAFRQMHGG